MKKSKIILSIEERPVLYLMFALGLTLFGVLSFQEIKFSLSRKEIYPGIAIRVDASGFDAYQTEEVITTPIEKIISTVGGIKEIRSISESGKSVIQVQMERNLDLKTKALEIREKIDLISYQFPREVHKPMVYRFDPGNTPAMVATFYNEGLTQDELRELVEKTYKAELENIEGVSQVIVAGGRIREILVACDAKQLEAYTLNLRDIVNKIQDWNANFSLGNIRVSDKDSSVFANSKFSDLYALRNIPLVVDSAGRVVFLHDVAKVSLEPRDDEIGARLNAEERVSVFIYNNQTSDILKISGQARSLFSSKKKGKLEVIVTQDEAFSLINTIRSLLISGFFIIFLILLFFYRNADFKRFFPFYLMSIPSSWFIFSLAIGIGRFDLSLAFSYGFIVGQIFWGMFVLRVYRFKKKNIYLFDYYKFSLLFVIILGVSVVFLLLSEGIFLFWFEFVFAICFSVISSYLLFPVFYINLGDSVLFLWIHRENRYFIKYYDLLCKFLVKKGFDWRKKTEDSLFTNIYLYPVSLVFLSLLGIYTLFSSGLKYSIDSDKKEVIAFLEFPPGTSFQHTSQITLSAEKKILTVTGVKEVISKIDPAHSLLLIKLDDGNFPDRDFLSSLKTSIGSTDDGFLYFSSDEDSKFFKEVAFDVIGYDIKDLEKHVSRVAEKVKSMEGVAESVLRFKPSREELQLSYNPYKFELSDMKFHDFGDNLRLAIQGGVATKYLDQEREVDIRVRYAEEYRKSSDHLSEIRIKNSSGRFVPISELVHPKEALVPQKIYHKNRSRSLSFAVKMEGNSRSELDSLIDTVMDSPLPEGYRVELSNEEDKGFFGSDFFQKIIFLNLLWLNPLIYFSLTGNLKKSKSYILKTIAPLFFSIFLWKFFFSSVIYLPFLIGLGIGHVFGIFLLESKYHLTQYPVFYFVSLFIPFIIISDASLISLVHIFSAVLLFCFCLLGQERITREWNRKYENQSMILLLWELVQKFWRLANEKMISLKRKKATGK
ncbi:acriflavin resistance protein [Leptospira kobayashii]|uniref:Acriflavin resistance protein n=1 Tax=Leptospira kobayashii TaxID=1917830 RepID=A0ABN6KKB0_9LEPT|nr:efflux RND transporter permease subunit [Leptospira kobayashii]BDA79611.1 acriflavin resistance protein [Leptospira kobayashii]